MNNEARLREALEQIEEIIADHERVLILPGVSDIKRIWNIARNALAETRGSPQKPSMPKMPWDKE